MVDNSVRRSTIFNKLSRPENSSAPKSSTWLQPQNLKTQTSEDLCTHFCRVLGAHNTFTQTIPDINSLPNVVAEHLNKLAVVPKIYGSVHSPLKQLAWGEVSIDWDSSSFTEDGKVAISMASYGIADTGTLVLLGDEENPTRNNFLAEHHIIVLRLQNLLAYSEDVWEKLTAENKKLPRAINFISGPSSSADVGLKLEYGAHGPRSLAVFISER